MKKTQMAIAIFATALLLIISNISFAQPSWLNSSAEEIPKAFMAHEDANGDGKVTMEEFQGPEGDFEFFDKNSDGVIELSEAATPDNLPDGINAGPSGSGEPANAPSDTPAKTPVSTVTLNGVVFNLYSKYDFFTWKDLPADVKYERMPIKAFTGPDGITHYYEAVYLPSGNLNWFQAAYLAQDAGGYLASITSKEENAFVFNLVSDKKYFWFFPPYDGRQPADHHEIGIGPFLGGYQPEGSPEPAGGWKWLSGDKWDYTNWAVDLNDGVIDKDPRDDTQPNDSGGSQRVMGFGEMNKPVPTWGDYMDGVGDYGITRKPGSCYGFVIEYEKRP